MPGTPSTEAFKNKPDVIWPKQYFYWQEDCLKLPWTFSISAVILCSSVSLLVCPAYTILIQNEEIYATRLFIQSEMRSINNKLFLLKKTRTLAQLAGLNPVREAETCTPSLPNSSEVSFRVVQQGM